MITILWHHDTDGRVSYVDCFDSPSLAVKVCQTLNRYAPVGTRYSLGPVGNER